MISSSPIRPLIGVLNRGKRGNPNVFKSQGGVEADNSSMKPSMIAEVSRTDFPQLGSARTEGQVRYYCGKKVHKKLEVFPQSVGCHRA